MTHTNSPAGSEQHLQSGASPYDLTTPIISAPQVEGPGARPNLTALLTSPGVILDVFVQCESQIKNVKSRSALQNRTSIEFAPRIQNSYAGKSHKYSPFSRGLHMDSLLATAAWHVHCRFPTRQSSPLPGPRSPPSWRFQQKKRPEV